MSCLHCLLLTRARLEADLGLPCVCLCCCLSWLEENSVISGQILISGYVIMVMTLSKWNRPLILADTADWKFCLFYLGESLDWLLFSGSWCWVIPCEAVTEMVPYGHVQAPSPISNVKTYICSFHPDSTPHRFSRFYVNCNLLTKIALNYTCYTSCTWSPRIAVTCVCQCSGGLNYMH